MEFINLYDPDSTAENLIFKVIPPKRVTPSFDTIFEINQKTVDTFSYQDLMDERVWLKVTEKVSRSYLSVYFGIYFPAYAIFFNLSFKN